MADFVADFTLNPDGTPTEITGFASRNVIIINKNVGNNNPIVFWLGNAPPPDKEDGYPLTEYGDKETALVLTKLYVTGYGKVHVSETD